MIIRRGWARYVLNCGAHQPDWRRSLPFSSLLYHSGKDETTTQWDLHFILNKIAFSPLNPDMAEEEEESELSDKHKVEIAKWFLLNSPPGEIKYVAKGSSSSSSLFLFFLSIYCSTIRLIHESFLQMSNPFWTTTICTMRPLPRLFPFTTNPTWFPFKWPIVAET